MARTEAVDEGGDGYFASVSDLMVGILFVFLLMLTVFALNFRDAEDDHTAKLRDLEIALARAAKAEADANEAKAEAKEQEARAMAARAEAERQQNIAQMEREAADEQRRKNEELRNLLRKAVARMREELEGRQAARARLLSHLERRLRDDGMVVNIDPESGVLRLPEQLLFDQGQSELGVIRGRGLVPSKLAEAQANLAKLARALGDVLPCFARGSTELGCDEQDRSSLEGVLIEGHSDRQGYRVDGRVLSPEESRDRNDRLSVERALNVFKELRQRNNLDDLRNGNGFPMLAVSSYGDRRPIADGDTADSFRQNRRIDLRFLLSSRTSDELQRLIDEISPALGDGS